MALAKPDISAPGPSVFLSFCAKDGRNSFVDSLHSALRSENIPTFRDDADEDLAMGKLISDQNYQATAHSKIAIVVLSEDYFSSERCLQKLVTLMDSSDEQGQTVQPVYYGVNPWPLEWLKGSTPAAFKELEARFSADTVRRWKQASTWIASFPEIAGNEEKAIEDIVGLVKRELNSRFPTFDFGHSVGDISNRLVGDVQSKVDKIISLSKIGSDEVCVVGICGTGGLGKTTLARLVYKAVYREFDASCFLSNIRGVSRRHGLASIQRMLLLNLGLIARDIDDPCEGSGIIRRLLCNKKVLIIFDDVNHKSQLENLAGSSGWFGRGSKIIITTRDKGLLTVVDGQCEIYEVGTLDPDESLELFCQRAFEKNEPEQGYWDLSREIIQYAGGVPLALEVFGSFVSNGLQSELRNVLHQYRERLPVDIFDMLRISYHGLEEKCKMIFLDIACFFNGRTKFEVTDILKICYDRSIYDEIKVLVAKSLLISTESNSNSRYNAEGEDLQDRLQKMRSDIFLPTSMCHELINEASRGSLHMFYFVEEMGRNIVYDESPSDPGSRSRLWHIEDIDRVLKGNEGTEYIQSIVVSDLNDLFKAEWHPECFSKMQNLRLLDLSRVALVDKLNQLPRAVKFLRWDNGYGLHNLPPIDQLRDLEGLQLRGSSITRLWDRVPELNKLRTIDLSNSRRLSQTPDFSGTPNLEKLFFNHCSDLIRVHESVGQLKKLVELSLRCCKKLESLPTLLDMDNLEVFILEECRKLEKLPEFSKGMRRLYFLDVRKTNITEIPSSIINLENLKYLDLTLCSKLKSIPELPPNSIIRASDDLATTYSASDPRRLIESRVSKHPIHLVIDSEGKQVIPPWFEQQEHRYSKDASGEVVTITADIPSDDLANCEGIAVYIIFDLLSHGKHGQVSP